MYLADTLSRAYLPEVNVCESIQKLEEVDHTSTLAIPADRIERLKQASSEDPVLDVLIATHRFKRLARNEYQRVHGHS